MRYDKSVQFILNRKSYNPDTGDYEETKSVIDEVMASVVSSSTETMEQVYGGFKLGSKTIHIRGIQNRKFDLIKIDGIYYQVDNYRRLRTKEAYTISEIQA